MVKSSFTQRPYVYVFDVLEENEDGEDRYLTYDDYKLLLDKYDIDYILPLCVIQNATYDSYINQLEKNVFLIQDGKGCGEGIVIKNYDFYKDISFNEKGNVNLAQSISLYSINKKIY